MQIAPIRLPEGEPSLSEPDVGQTKHSSWQTALRWIASSQARGGVLRGMRTIVRFGAAVVACSSLVVPSYAEEKSSVAINGSAEISHYVDTDNVTVTAPTVGVIVRDEAAGWSAGGRYLIDVVTAASVDVVSMASPAWTEVRHVVSANGDYKIDDLKVGASASASLEPDYTSLSAGLNGSLVLDEDHITLAGGYFFGHDTAGRAGTPFEVFHRNLVRHSFSLGASFVLNPSSLLWVGVDAIFEQGNQAKPYRYVPLFSGDIAPRLPNGASVDLVNEVRLFERPLEQLPLSRDRYAFTARYLHRSSWATFRLEERFYVDNWGVLASSTDVAYAMDLSKRLVVAPSIRFHVQGPASFWKRAYVAESSEGTIVIPTLRTGDRELGPLWIGTLGSDVRWRLSDPFSVESRTFFFRLAGVQTSYLDSLYISQRTGLFTALGFEGVFH